MHGDGLVSAFLQAHRPPCPACGYTLEQAAEGRCPECGREIRLGLDADHERSVAYELVLAGVAAGGSTFGAGTVFVASIAVFEGSMLAGAVLCGLAGAGLFVFALVWCAMVRSRRRMARTPADRRNMLPLAVWVASFALAGGGLVLAGALFRELAYR